jgi:site-specific DNA recombinase
MNCAHDGCMLTGDIQKQKYVYYRCTGNRGPCDLPRFREEDIAARLGEPLKDLQVPANIVAQIVAALRENEQSAKARIAAEGVRLQTRLTAIRNRLDAVYADKVDGTVDEAFWQRKSAEWGAE